MEDYMLLSIIVFFFLPSFPLSHSEPDMEYGECRPSPCGKLGEISYPFWSEEIRPTYCGRDGFKLNCPQDEDDYPVIQIDSQTFNVTQIDIVSHKMTLMRTDFVYDNCSSSHLTNTSVSTPLNLFHYDEPSVKNVTLFYDCPSDSSIGGIKFSCQPGTSSNFSSNNYAFDSEYVVIMLRFSYLINNCKHHIQVPADSQAFQEALGKIDEHTQDYSRALQEAMAKGFRVQYNVDDSSNSSRHSWKSKFIIGVGGAIGLLLLGITICCCKIKSWGRRIGLYKTSKVDRDIEAFIRNHGPLALTRYKFVDIKKMTNSFKDKLGQGGYGSVYKGELPNGCLVAIKLLKASKGNGEDFINEVASISKTSHVNVVTLLGFCWEGQKKALIYQFMSNGSLDKFIHNNTNKSCLYLTWENLYQIAIGIARGLEYLYRGCNTRIIHFDIKPHNILLDEGLCPKISDFGLAKLCPKKESIISISQARGTIGYLAPELWNRNIGGVSHKSDVYSFGMMLLDMVGGRKNMNYEDCTTDIYFPDWIYDKLELEQGGQDGVHAIEENDVAKKLTIVGLWCIQIFPTQRPTISKVIEMLEESLDSLEMPPKPVMLSPPRLEQESFTTCNTKSERVDSNGSSSQMVEIN